MPFKNFLTEPFKVQDSSAKPLVVRCVRYRIMIGYAVVMLNQNTSAMLEQLFVVQETSFFQSIQLIENFAGLKSKINRNHCRVNNAL